MTVSAAQIDHALQSVSPQSASVLFDAYTESAESDRHHLVMRIIRDLVAKTVSSRSIAEQPSDGMSDQASPDAQQSPTKTVGIPAKTAADLLKNLGQVSYSCSNLCSALRLAGCAEGDPIFDWAYETLERADAIRWGSDSALRLKFTATVPDISLLATDHLE